MGILDSVKPVYQTTPAQSGGVTFFIPHQFGGEQILDRGATAGNAALAYQRQADSALQGALGAAQGAIGAADRAYNNAQGQISKVNKFAGEAADSARGIGNAITNVNRTAGEVKGQAALINQSANALSPFINTLGQQGNQIYQQGLDLYQQANPYLAAGRDILNLNTNAGGLTGAYLDALLAVDPDRYVSMAAGDVQASWANAQGQMQREMSRMGVDAGSGKYMAQMQMFSQGLAAALAGAKTRARQVGINEKLSAMQGAMGVGQQLGATGASMAGAGIQAQAQGAGVTGQAGSLQATQGQLQAQAGGVMAQAGSLEAQAGQLAGVQANAYTAAGQQTLGAINAGLQAAGLQVQAAGQMGQVQMNAANYYAQIGQGWGQIAGGAGLMRALSDR